MEGETQAEKRRFQYLLGLSDQAERERLESEYFGNEDAFQEMLTAEDDLIDAYARGELSSKERAQFERLFLNSSQGRERVRFARTFGGATLGSRVIETKQVERPALPGFFAWIQTAPARVGAMMVLVFVASGFGWLLFDRGRMRDELQALRAERARLSQQTAELERAADLERAKTAEAEKQRDELQAKLQVRQEDEKSSLPIKNSGKNEQVITRRNPSRNQPSRSNDSIPGTFVVNPGTQDPRRASVSFDLSPGNVRSGGGTTLSIPRNSNSVVLRLLPDTVFPDETYRARIETASGNIVSSMSSLKTTNGEYLELPPITTSTINPGHYVLFLERPGPDGTFTRVAEYSFRVPKF